MKWYEMSFVLLYVLFFKSRWVPGMVLYNNENMIVYEGELIKSF